MGIEAYTWQGKSIEEQEKLFLNHFKESKIKPLIARIKYELAGLRIIGDCGFAV